MAKELSEKTLSYLKKIGITAEAIDELNEGKNAKADEALKTYNEKIIDTSRERIENELKSELETAHKEELETAKKEAQIGSQNAAKNQFIDLAKSIGISISKADFDGKDLKTTLSALKEKLAEKLKSGKEGESQESESQKATIQDLETKLAEANKILADQKTAIESHPKQIETAISKALNDIELQATQKEIFTSYGDKILPQYRDEKGKKMVALLLEKEMREKGIKFEPFVGADGKKTWLPKIPQTKNGETLKDKNGEPIYIPFQKDTTSNHSIESFYSKFFEDNELVTMQGDSNGTPPQNPQNSNGQQDKSKPNPYTAKEWTGY